MKFNLDRKKIAICFIAVFGMGFFLSFLMLCGLGTDPCSFMNKSVSTRLGMTFGNWQLIINSIMLIAVIFLRRDLLGFGTIFNMVLVGYYVDFFDWVWSKVIPASVFESTAGRWGVFIPALLCFIISAAVYINCDMGVAPYDALPKYLTDIVASKFPKSPSMLIRICWDAAAIVIGTLAGGIPVIGIILMALFLGPVISLVGKLFFRENGSDRTSTDKPEKITLPGEPALHKSICTGEATVGYIDPATGHFRDLKKVDTESEIISFCKEVGIDRNDLKTIY